MNTVLCTPSYDRIVKIMKYFGTNVPVAAPLPHNNRRSRKHLIGRACLLPPSPRNPYNCICYIINIYIEHKTMIK